MSTTKTRNEIADRLNLQMFTRMIAEGYGPGAWHGPDLKAALDGVTEKLAFRRPSDEGHHIAEIALHHAYCARAVRGKLSNKPLEPFVMEGEDWFPLPDPDTLSWSRIRATLESEQKKLAALVADIADERVSSPLSDAECFDIVLGVTCHAVYHAGQIQLIKKLTGK